MASLRSQQDLHTINSDNPKSSTVPIGFMKYNNYRGKKQIRTGARASHSSCGYGVFVVIALCLVSFTVIGGNYLFSFLRNHKGRPAWLQTHDFFENQDPLQRNASDSFKLNTNWKDDIDGEKNHETKREVQFGRTFVQEDFVNRDSRYWDKDDRKRNKYSDYYDDDDIEMDDEQINGHILKGGSLKSDEKMKPKRDGSFSNVKRESDPRHQQETPLKLSSIGNGGLYNERGRKELREHEQKLEDAFESELYPSKVQHTSVQKTRRQQRDPCHIDFLNTSHGFPEPNSRFRNFSLNYIHYEDSEGVPGWETRFAGHQTLLQRNRSFQAMDQTIHCGFVQESGSSRTSGFDLTEEDTRYMSTCKVAVISCIFGSSDNIRSPRIRLTGSFKKDVCFVMFVDQQTLDVLKEEGQQSDERGYVGLWKLVLVSNMPYTDARRVGKIPKFLAHRLFPTARFSIWLDSKLRLQNDPILILEYFLWRKGHEYAISNHYDRHCVWEEVQQNKKLNKYNHTAIDEQFAFYQKDGLTRFNASDPKKLLPSNVPEGSFIIREHSPMSNLFSCLWFNEVDRFTSRDQLSFAYTYTKFVRTNPGKRFYLNMFKDCERKSMTKLFRHRKTSSNSMSDGAIV